MSYKSEFFGEGGALLVNLKCIARGGGFIREGLKPYVGEYKPQHVVEPGDLVIAITDLTRDGDVVGRPARVDDVAGRSLVASLDVLKAEFVDPALDPLFLYYRLQAADYAAYVQGCATGTTVRHLAPRDVEAFSFSLPPIRVQRRVADVLSSVEGVREELAAQRQRADELSVALIASLMSGDHEIPATYDTVLTGTSSE